MEYRLFGQVTRALIAASEVDPSDFATRIDALDWNRRLWATLASDCSSEHNTLPKPVRAQMISLSLWVNRHTTLVMRKEENFEALIEVNRIIMQGLAGQVEAA
ncbi:flagellar biosynthesis regulator FlaF [soil metagenome]